MIGKVKRAPLDEDPDPLNAVTTAASALLNVACPPDPLAVMAFQSAYAASGATPFTVTGVYDDATVAALYSVLGTAIPLCPSTSTSAPLPAPSIPILAPSPAPAPVAAPPAAPASSNTMLIVGGVVAVGALGVLGYLLLGGRSAVAIANPRRRSRRRRR